MRERQFKYVTAGYAEAERPTANSNRLQGGTANIAILFEEVGVPAKVMGEAQGRHCSIKEKSKSPMSTA